MQSSETKFLRIFDNGVNFDQLQLSDAKLQTDDGCTFDIHRVILARSSDYFRDMFCGMDQGRSEFRIPGISGECLSDVLCYLYTGDITVTERNVRDLMIGANYLLLRDLHMKIKQSIKDNMTEVNCLKILHAAHQISDEDIFQECFRFIQTRFESIMRCQKNDLADLTLEILISILSNRSLYVYNENTVWQAIVEWTQKNFPFRKHCVPQLLLTLAMEDMGEELATEILQHEIILKNTSMKDLIEIRSLVDSTSNLEVLSSFLLSYSVRFAGPFSHRFPLKLQVISSHTRGESEAGNSSNLYITYDENTDLWRQITEVSFWPDFLIAIGSNIYIFEMREKICRNFNLSVMEWVPMERFRYAHHIFCVVAIDAYIYVLGDIFQNFEYSRYDIEVYDTANNVWFDGVSLNNICHGAAVAIEKKIYVVGNTRRLDGMMTQMFDPVSQQWSILSPPSVYRSSFALVAHKQKMYLVGGMNSDGDVSKTEVFDPATNLWKELPDLPYTYRWTNAGIFNDQIVVYEDDYEFEPNTKNVRWNDEKECWEKLDKTLTFKDFNLHRFCIVDDVETIRMITKQNRDPETQMEKSLFN